MAAVDDNELTLLAGPVAGKPRVMLGSEGDVYRDSWLTEPSLVASLWSSDICGESQTQSDRR